MKELTDVLGMRMTDNLFLCDIIMIKLTKVICNPEDSRCHWLSGVCTSILYYTLVNLSNKLTVASRVSNAVCSILNYFSCVVNSNLAQVPSVQSRETIHLTDRPEIPLHGTICLGTYMGLCITGTTGDM